MLPQDDSLSSPSTAKRHKPQPSSLSLRVPRSASVQQLVQQWEADQQRSSGSSIPAASPSSDSQSTSFSSSRRPSAALSGSIPVRPPQPSRSADTHLRATPTNAVNGTLGPLDWSPKYGLGFGMEHKSNRAKQPKTSPASHRSPETESAAPSSPQDPFLDPDPGTVTPEQRPTPASASTSSPKHFIPLRSIPPEPTIPLPKRVPSHSGTTGSVPPSNPTPPALSSSISPRRASATPAGRPSVARSSPAPKPSQLRIATPSTRQLSAPIQVSPSSTFPDPLDVSPSLSSATAVASPTSLDLPSSASRPYPCSSSSAISSTHDPLQCAASPQKNSARTPIKYTLPHSPLPPIKEGLAKTAHDHDIFDLEAKVPLDDGRFLPSSFRRLPSRDRGSIPNRSSSSLQSGQIRQSIAPHPRSSHDAAEYESFPLVSRIRSFKSEDKGGPDTDAVDPADYNVDPSWSRVIADDAYEDATCSNVDGERLPIPADQVFQRSAHPLHLPALEEYLRNPILFGEPSFSASKSICTQEEKILFGLDDSEVEQTPHDSWFTAVAATVTSSKSPSLTSGSRKKHQSAQLEVAGAQITCPAQLYKSSVEAEPAGSSRKGLRKRTQPVISTQHSPAKYKALQTGGNGDDLEALAGGQVGTPDFDDGKTVVESDDEQDSKANAADQLQAEKVASRISERLSRSRQCQPVSGSDVQGSGLSQPFSEGVSSKLSTKSNPLTRNEMFPPLMLLKNNTLDELKSNAIGPRKPPGFPWSINWLGTIFDMFIGIEGSSFAAGLIRLEAFRDLFQIMAMQLNFEKYVSTSANTPAEKVSKFLLQTLPNFLGLDFVSVFGYAVIFFLVWICLTGLALVHFWRMTRAYNPNKNVEGFDSQGWIYKSASRGTRLANTFLVFVLGLLYLPLSKLAVNALVWSSDFWPVPNPYVGGVDKPLLPPPLGDPDVWRQPFDFCYTTTMRKDSFNWAYLIIPLAALTIIFYTLWYPFKLMVTIKEMLPHVSPYNELGRRRSEEEMQVYYKRLLDRDKSPFNFLYNSYHRRWGYYKPFYILVFKLTNLVIIGVLAKDNCLFRSFPTKRMLVVQQSTLITVMSLLLGVHLYIKPFVDKIGNRSEMVSRIGYVLTATIGLLVALNVQGSTVYNTTILYIVQAFTYGGNIYFALIGTGFAAHHVKQWQSRVDFTIDIFSPLLDVTKHIKRRIWEETLSIILLCGRQYHMPLDQVIAFSVSEEDHWPPYLIDFHGSVAERHIENLKIVKQIGIERYRSEIDISRTRQGIYRQELVRDIQRRFAGLDTYWRPLYPPFPTEVMSFFGKAFMIPFPPTLVIRYDEGSSHTLRLTQIEEFEAFIQQNSSPEVMNKKMIRRAIRALEGQKVFCPYVDSIQVGESSSGIAAVDKMFGRLAERKKALPRFDLLADGDRRNEYALTTPISYLEGTLKIERRHESESQGYNFGTGFEVSIIYEEGRMKETTGALTTVRRRFEVSASRAFGLTEDFEMNTQLSRFLQDNESLIIERVPLVEKILKRYRKEFEAEARWKEKTLPYSFLTDIFDNDGLSPMGLRMALVDIGCRRDVRNLPVFYEGCITLMYERLAAINRSPVHRFWWLLFDEIWRLNSGDYKLLRKYRRSLSPQYPTSIAYRPMPREALERFLLQKSLWKDGGAKGGPFNRGLLNRIYFYLNEIVFAGHHDGVTSPNRGWSARNEAEADLRRRGDSRNPFADPMDTAMKRAATIHVGLGKEAQDVSRRDFSTVNSHTIGVGGTSRSGVNNNTSVTPSHYTGGGTAYSVDSVIVRGAYTWEQRLDGHRRDTNWQRFKTRALEWLSLHPVEVDFDRQKLFLYLKLVPTGPRDSRTGKQGYRYELLKESCRRIPRPGPTAPAPDPDLQPTQYQEADQQRD